MNYTVFCRETRKALRTYSGTPAHLIVKAPNEEVVEGRFWPDYSLDIRSDDMGEEMCVPVPCAPQPRPWEDVTLDTSSDTPRWVISQSTSAARAEAWAAVKLHRSSSIFAPLKVDDMLFDVKGDSLALITAKLQEMTLLGLQATVWTLSNNAQVIVSADTLRRVVVGFSKRAEAAHLLSQDLRSRIESAETAGAALGVVWPPDFTSLDF